MRNSNRPYRNQEHRGQQRSYGRSENPSYPRQSQERNQRSEWYDRDPMDERSGYRDEERDYDSSRMDSSQIRGYDDHYRYDQNYHNYYGSANYNPDQERQRRRESVYDSDRYNRGQGAYGTSSSGRASWDTGITDRTSSSSAYGATQGSWSPAGEESRSSFYGRGPRNFKRSDERIREEVCEMLTRHSSIDANEIDVDVKDGEVILSGSVSERRMRHLAEDCAEQCFGVKDVVNNIRVKRGMSESVSSREELPPGTSAKKSSTLSTSGSSSSDTRNPNH